MTLSLETNQSIQTVHALAVELLETDNPSRLINGCLERIGLSKNLVFLEDAEGSGQYAEVSYPIATTVSQRKILGTNNENEGRLQVIRYFPYGMRPSRRYRHDGELVLSDRVDMPYTKRFATEIPLGVTALVAAIEGVENTAHPMNDWKLATAQDILRTALFQSR